MHLGIRMQLHVPFRRREKNFIYIFHLTLLLFGKVVKTI